MEQRNVEDLTELAKLIMEAFQTFRPEYCLNWCACKIPSDLLEHDQLSKMRLDFRYLTQRYGLKNEEFNVSFYGLSVKKNEKQLNCGPNPVSTLARTWLREKREIIASIDLWKPTYDLFSIHIEPHDLEPQVIKSLLDTENSVRVRVYFTGFIGNPAVVYKTKLEIIPTVITATNKDVKLDLYSACHQRGLAFVPFSSNLIAGIVTPELDGSWSGFHLWKKEGDIYRLVEEISFWDLSKNTLSYMIEKCISERALRKVS